MTGPRQGHGWDAILFGLSLWEAGLLYNWSGWLRDYCMGLGGGIEKVWSQGGPAVPRQCLTQYPPSSCAWLRPVAWKGVVVSLILGGPQGKGSGSSGKEEEDHLVWLSGVLVWWGQGGIPLWDYIKAIKWGF